MSQPWCAIGECPTCILSDVLGTNQCTLSYVFSLLLQKIWKNLGSVSSYIFATIRSPIIKIRWSWDHVIFYPFQQCHVIKIYIINHLWPKASYLVHLNTLRPRQDGRHFPDDILKCIFLNENVWIPLTIWLKCVWKVRINNIPPLVQINGLTLSRREVIIWANDG